LECGLGIRLDIEPSAHVLIALFMKGGQSGHLEMQCRPLNRGERLPFEYGIALELFCLAAEIVKECFASEG
jgi:hypothetical protein